MRVEVYRNLHTGLMSVREAHGRVLTHEERVFIGFPKFVVQPAGREKVLREQRKNVHAFVRGVCLGFSEGNLSGFTGYTEWRQATYNPYKFDCFVDKETEAPLYSATHAVVTTTGVYYTHKGSK